MTFGSLILKSRHRACKIIRKLWENLTAVALPEIQLNLKPSLLLHYWLQSHTQNMPHNHSWRYFHNSITFQNKVPFLVTLSYFCLWGMQRNACTCELYNFIICVVFSWESKTHRLKHCSIHINSSSFHNPMQNVSTA